MSSPGRETIPTAGASASRTAGRGQPRGGRDAARTNGGADAVAPKAVVASLLALAACLNVDTARAAESGEETTVRIASVCGTETQTDTLVAEVRSRLPSYEIRETDGEADVSVENPGVVWERGEDASCELVVTTGGGTTRLTLAGDAEEASIRQAASRVAWLVTARRDVERTPPEREQSDGESSANEAEPTEEQPAESEPTDEQEETADEQGEAADEQEETAEQQETDEQTETAEEGATDTQQETDRQTESSESELRTVPTHWTLVPPFGYPAYEGRTAPWFAMHLVGAHYGVRGLELGLVNIKNGFARGAQLGGILNYVGGPATGLQASLLGNMTFGDLTGTSTTLGANLANGVEGLQVAGGANVATAGVDGLQFAVGGNWAVDDVRGVQAGAINVAGGVPGLQVGLLNLSRRVEGAQVGLLNVARDSDLSLGLLSVNWDRPVYVGSLVDVTGFTTVELKHGSRHVHNIVIGGVNPLAEDLTGLGGLGLGTRIGQKPLSLDIDALFMFVSAAAGTAAQSPPLARWGQLRATVQWSLFDRFALMAGGSLNLLANDVPADQLIRISPALPSIVVSEQQTVDGFQPTAWAWPGIHLGVRF